MTISDLFWYAEAMDETAIKPGDIVTWIGTAHLFEQAARVVAVRNSYLTILGETPENGHLVYDIDARPRIKGTVFAIPREQLIRQ